MTSRTLEHLATSSSRFVSSSFQALFPSEQSSAVKSFAFDKGAHSNMSAAIVSRSTLGHRPQAVNNLNGESFQQDVLVTHNSECTLRMALTFRLAVLRGIHRSCRRRAPCPAVTQATSVSRLAIDCVYRLFADLGRRS